MIKRMPYLFILVLTAETSVGAVPAQQAPTVKLLYDPVIAIDMVDSSGQSTALLHNYSAQPVSVSLYISPQGKDQTAFPLDATLSADKNPASIPLELTIPASGTVPLTVSVTGDKFIGDVQFVLSDTRAIAAGKESDLGHVIARRAPLDIKVQSVTGDKLKLALVDHEPTTLAFQNNDPLAYDLQWAISADGETICKGAANLNPHELAPITCTPAIGWKSLQLQSFLKDEPDRPDILVSLSAIRPSSSDATVLKTLPIAGNLNVLGSVTRQAGNYLLIVVFLTLGGVCSLLLSQLIPNRLQRINIRESLSQLSLKTADLSTRIDSRLAVLVRLERRRLSDVLRSRNSFSPDFASVASEATAGALKLHARVGLLELLDSVLGRLAKMAAVGAPPSQIEAINRFVQQATVLLSKAEATDADVIAAQSSITQASDMVDKLNQRDPTFAADLARRMQLLKRDIDGTSGTSTYVRLLPVFNGLLQALATFVNGLAPNNPEPISPDRYTELDVIYTKLNLAREYILLMERAPADDVRQRLARRETALLGYLLSDNWESLQRARRLLREMKDDIYPERLREAARAGQMYIRMDPDIAYEMASLEFCLCFQNALLDSSAAREEWTCKWKFGDDLEGSGWTISHYFQLLRRRPSSFAVHVRLFDADGSPITNEDGSPIVVDREVLVRLSDQRRGVGERSIVEALKLGAALLIAVFGLVAGARDQLAKLDVLPGLVAIFLIGFSADTIKNLLAPKDVKVMPK